VSGSLEEHLKKVTNIEDRIISDTLYNIKILVYHIVSNKYKSGEFLLYLYLFKSIEI
jgi:hypothetical protein